MSTVIDELIVELGIDNKDFVNKTKMTKQELKELEKQTKETAAHMKEAGHTAGEFYETLKEKALGFFVAIAGYEVKEFVENQMKAEISTLRLSKAIGMSITELQKWQGAAVLEGGDAEGVNANLKQMGENLIFIEKGLPRSERALKAFKAAGITGLAKGKHTDILDVFAQLATQFEGKGSIEASALGRRMGITDAGLLRVLRKGKEGISELMNEAGELGLFTKEEAEASLKLEEAQLKLGLSTKNVGRSIMSVMLPALQAVTDGLLAISKWVGEHKDALLTTFTALAAGITAMGAAAWMMAPALITISWPIMLIGAAVAALAAGVTWLVLKWQAWNKAGQESVTWWGRLFMIVKDTWDAVGGFITTYFLAYWDVFKDELEFIWESLRTIWAFLTGDQKDFEEAIGRLSRTFDKFVRQVRGMLIYGWYYALDVMHDAWKGKLGEMKNEAKDFIIDWLNPLSQKHVAGKMVHGLLTADVVQGAAFGGLGKGWNINNMLGHTPIGSIYIESVNVTAPNGATVDSIAMSAHKKAKEDPVFERIYGRQAVSGVK